MQGHSKDVPTPRLCSEIPRRHIVALSLGDTFGVGLSQPGCQKRHTVMKAVRKYAALWVTKVCLLLSLT